MLDYGSLDDSKYFRNGGFATQRQWLGQKLVINRLRMNSDGEHMMIGKDNGCNIFYARSDGQIFSGTGTLARLSATNNNGCGGA